MGTEAASANSHRTDSLGKSFPKITIVTPSYNQGRYIEETVRSILLQNYPNLEYLIFDAGSTDQTMEILKRYEPWLDYCCSERDRGQAHAVNKGFARATGDLLNWVNSDDVLFPGALQAVAQAARERLSENVIFYGNRIRFDADGRRFDFDLPPKHLTLLHFLIGSHIPQETAFISRAAYEKLGPLNEERKFALDYDYWARAIVNGTQFRHVGRFLGGMRFHELSKSLTWTDINVSESADIRGMLLAHVRMPKAVVERFLGVFGAASYHFSRSFKKPLYKLAHNIPRTIYEM
jgi:glycosyltransferase involved in cell wall biosynthesis